jgi:aldehyde:ferredoxin oxidoreductase
LQRDPEHGLVKLAPMLKKYYRIRGWDERGIPKEKRLKKLGLR